MSIPRSTTPPNFPTFGVDLAPSSIKNVLAITSPGKALLSSDRLDSSRSFNNRIYFLHLEQEENINDKSSTKRNGALDIQVMKIPGRFFGANKIQNEVACLLLLEQHCPKIPVPRVLAYSEDGGEIVALRREGIGSPSPSAERYQHPPVGDDAVPRGWILMTRCPGRPLQANDIAGSSGTEVLKELAQYVAEWRQSLPAVHQIGNLSLDQSESEDLAALSNPHTSLADLGRISISGLLQTTPSPSPTPPDSPRIPHTHTPNPAPKPLH